MLNFSCSNYLLQEKIIYLITDLIANYIMNYKISYQFDYQIQIQLPISKFHANEPIHLLNTNLVTDFWLAYWIPIQLPNTNSVNDY